MRRLTHFIMFVCIAASLLCACSTFDCPLNNRVYASMRLAGEVKTLDDTLTVSIPLSHDDDGSDTVVVNRLTGTDSLALPMSYMRTEDIYLLHIAQRDTRLQTTDTMWVAKENEKHFESVDCSPAMFHTITGIRFTQHAIDSITINNNKVTYNDSKAHFLIYLKNRSN